MGAAVEQHMDAAVVVAAHDHGLASEFGRSVVAWVRYLARMADIEPGAAEDALHLEFENVGVHIDAPVHAARLDQFCNPVRMSVAHIITLRPDGRRSAAPH